MVNSAIINIPNQIYCNKSVSCQTEFIEQNLLNQTICLKCKEPKIPNQIYSIKAKSNPSLSWAWPSSAPACYFNFLWIWFGFSFWLNRFGLVFLVLHIQNTLLGRLDFVDSVLLLWFGKFGSINSVWYIWLSPQGINLFPLDLFGIFGLLAS